jgi:hypothetical protein
MKFSLLHKMKIMPDFSTIEWSGFLGQCHSNAAHNTLLTFRLAMPATLHQASLIV